MKTTLILLSITLLLVSATCDHCAECDQSICKKCESPYMLLGENCVEGNTILDFCEEYNQDKFGCKKCVQGYTPTLHGLCVKCDHIFGPDCVSCDQTNSEKCTECKPGATLTREGACIFCKKYFRQCAECDGMTMRCTKCSSGRKPENGFC